MRTTPKKFGFSAQLSAWFIVRRLARYNGVSMQAEYHFIKEKIGDAWLCFSTSNNTRFTEYWSMWFPMPRIPTVVEYLVTMKDAIVTGGIPPRLLDLRFWSDSPADMLHVKELKLPVGYNTVGQNRICLKVRILGLLILRKQAQLGKTSVRDVRKNIQRQLVDLWNTVRTTDDMEYREYWEARFSTGRPPTPEEYWLAMADGGILSIVPIVPDELK